MTIVHKWQRLPNPYQWAAACGVLLMVIAALVIAFVAYVGENNTASCVNSALGKRSGPTQLDEQAHIAFAKSIKVALNMPPTPDGMTLQHSIGAAVNDYIKALQHDQRLRVQTPLGKC